VGGVGVAEGFGPPGLTRAVARLFPAAVAALSVGRCSFYLIICLLMCACFLRVSCRGMWWQ
jgi:hypothetical protein